MTDFIPNDFTHDLDRKALAALKAIPGFSPLLRAFMKVFNERTERIINLSCCVRVSPTQMPELYNLLPPICEKLGIEIPEMFLMLDPQPNAYTGGDTQPYIVVHSGLIQYLSMDDVATVLAHECGHIACHHVLYHTMGRLLLNGGAAALGMPTLMTEALSIAFSYWMRCSEFSCDRCAAFVCGGAQPVIDVMLRLAGAGKDLGLSINREEFMAQSDEYKQYIGTSAWNRILEFLLLKNLNHPLLAVRARDIDQWCKSDAYLLVQQKQMLLQNSQSEGLYCPNCGAPVGAESKFCKNCGANLRQ